MQDIIKYQAKPGYVSRKIADELLLIPVGTKTTEFSGLVRINETGQFIWEQLSNPKTIMELTEIVKKEFEVKDCDVESDIDDFINMALQENLIEEV